MKKYSKSFKLKTFQIKRGEVLVHRTFCFIKLMYNIFLDKRIKIYENRKEILSVILKPKFLFH